ncbi:hypothetical protein D350_00005 [Enterococcus faecalis VC1B-1]|uniref:hypothetical protein n=1 Tax=Enterococcus faecalis TaxID=1351 RepID=UPI00036CCF1B|nr:hypothetical protein [Enterococcus faecalis]EPI34016.1 hypothetical protein D350_00005 [Enterococcus faecalis VC1B-1]
MSSEISRNRHRRDFTKTERKIFYVKEKETRSGEKKRAELALIKKLRALEMNIPERLKNEMPESPTNSEKNSNQKLEVLIMNVSKTGIFK